MAEYTTHYNLKKPAKNENYNIDVANQNNDIIDEKLYGKVDKKAGKDLSTNDFTNEYKKKLDTLKNYDDAEVIKQITSFNERAGKVEEANTEISKNVEALKTDNETNKTAISELKETTAQNSETITAIQEEQTTQNENIEKNAEGIAQNKKDVDEELTKIKKENSLLKSQIPEGHASGNDIHLEDSSNMPFEWRLNGGSRQEMREGYNLANLDADSFIKNGVTVTNNGDGSWTFNGKSSTAGDLVLTKNVLLSNKIYQFEDAKYLFKTIVVSGSFSNPDKVTVRTMGMGQDDGVDNFLILNNELRDGEFSKIFNKKSTSHLSRLELYCGPNVTFNNYTIKILFAKTDNKELEWEQYGVSPSLDFLSEIKNVGDNINLLNKDTVDASNNLRGNALDTGRRLIANKDGNYTYGAFKLGGRELLGKTLGIHADIKTTGGNPRISIFAGNSSSLTKSLLQVVLSASGTGYITIPSNLNSELDTISAILYVTTDARVVAGTYVDYTNLKVQVGSKKVVYSAYNCGSLGVTISNKNLYKIEKVINDTNYSKIIYKDENGNVSFATDGIPLIIAPTKIKEKTEYTYILKCKSNVSTENNINFTGIYEDGTSELLSANKKKDTNEFIVKFKTNKEKTLAYVTQQYTNSSRTTIITEGTMILEGDYLNLEELYEIHQEQEILFPLAEGQKLYEGSYLAKDGIHNKRISINGNEYKNTAGMNRAYSTENYNCFDIYTGLKFVKSENQYKTIGALCNQFKEKNWASFWQQKVNEEGFCINQDNRSTIYIKISKEICPDIDTFKKYIDENNLLFEIPLEQEEIIPYTPEQQAVIDKILYTYKNVTNISVDDELATLDITYKKDIETMFNNQAKEYNERLSNIENLLNTTETSALLLDNLENDLKEEV